MRNCPAIRAEVSTMVEWNDETYRLFFRDVNGFQPHEYQVDVARRLAAGENVMLGAPTGAGKTLTVLTPFLYEGWHPRPHRLIYALPLRTLAQSIYREAWDLARRTGNLLYRDFVTMQTGEQPDDEFFTRGRIIIATYDQVLSGLLDGPYGLSASQHNVNAAAMAGTLVVFDEFHLMEPGLAFLTGAAGLHLFRELAQCVWITATATAPLRAALAAANECRDASPSPRAVAALPTVGQVERKLVVHDSMLTPDAVLAACSGRTLVICNTVARAQAAFRALDAALPPDVPRYLLHSRFFRPDRADKEAAITRLLGKGEHDRAVVVATQVIEAGIDISCDDLHTELCPVNALVQRAGRCARYPTERGTVHVYRLPADERGWLPYGDLQAPSSELTATEQLLAALPGGEARLVPSVVAEWVERVHGGGDEKALRDGWGAREREVLGRIRLRAFERRRDLGVSDLIRQESTSDVRAIVARADDLPARPGQREPITISRWALPDALAAADPAAGDVAWGWSLGMSPGWEPIKSREEMQRQFVVCLAPSVARYTKELGLEIGLVGNQVSPNRVEPPRPGYAPMSMEGWADHARNVARAAQKRLDDEDSTGWLRAGLQRRYGLTPAELRTAVSACGLLHDFGKLQAGWQEWAIAWQRTKDESYVPVEALAHTTYNADNAADRAAQRGFTPKRPPHAAQGAYLALAALLRLLADMPAERRGLLASACAAAILAHHGGWLPDAPDLGLAGLWPGWKADLQRAAVNGQTPSRVQALLQERDRRQALEHVLAVTVGPDALAKYWPLVAYLTRTLRLADRRATAEAGSE
jgi:CRISPR-associated endonuclease/helicase Cas3